MYGNKNVFVTLTYNNEHLPPDGSLDYTHFQLFMKRLRKHFVPTCPVKKSVDPEFHEQFMFEHGIRFYMCGEYGDKNRRPHYHAILFNCTFDDKVKWRKTKTGFYQYVSKTLTNLWGYGNAEFGDVSFKSAAYVARYIMKKVDGDPAAMHYCDIDPETGEILAELKPEFSQMSRNGGIGKRWIMRYFDDVYPKGEVVVDGRSRKAPRYYDNLLKDLDPVSYERLKKLRALESEKHASDNTRERLLVREQVAQAKLATLVRPL